MRNRSGKNRLRINPRGIIALCLLSIVSVWLLTNVYGCMSLRPPTNTADLCKIFAEKKFWYRHAVDTEQRWNIDKTLLMAVIKQESSFVHDAEPPRKRILFVIPWKRSSSAYGYAQALNETWGDYQTRNNKPNASRTNFKDAIDFVGWYLDMAARETGLERDDARNLYVTYHEGIAGFQSKQWQSKQITLVAATKVQKTMLQYGQQLAVCDRGPARRR